MNRRRTYLIVGLAMLFVATASFVLLSKAKIKRTTRSPIVKEVNFDTSMGKSLSEDYKNIFKYSDDIARLDLFRSHYEEYLPSKVASSSTPKIPKIIHQIWLGPKLPPPYFRGFQDRLKALHPAWEYHLWTEAELDQLNLEMQDIINESSNYAEKADIIRCELLERFGGVYMDVDIECFQPLDDLHEKYDFYAGLEHPHQIATTPNTVWVGISIMASKPNHPIIKRWKELITSRWDKVNKEFTTQIHRVINHTYFPFTFAILDKLKEGNNTNMVFPTTYFYPLSPTHASKRRNSVRSIREKFYDFLEKISLKKRPAFSAASDETIAVHYWGGNWQPNQYEQFQDMIHQLELVRKELHQTQARLREVEKQQQALAALG